MGRAVAGSGGAGSGGRQVQDHRQRQPARSPQPPSRCAPMLFMAAVLLFMAAGVLFMAAALPCAPPLVCRAAARLFIALRPFAE
eukprot:3214450-Rhodomonas_salina.2